MEFSGSDMLQERRERRRWPGWLRAAEVREGAPDDEAAVAVVVAEAAVGISDDALARKEELHWTQMTTMVVVAAALLRPRPFCCYCCYCWNRRGSCWPAEHPDRYHPHLLLLHEENWTQQGWLLSQKEQGEARQ